MVQVSSLAADELKNFLVNSQQRVNNALVKAIAEQQSPFISPEEERLSDFQEAAAYCVSNGGKRLRPALVYATALALSDDVTANAADAKALDLLAAAIECIHSYSLVHDDLPAMDDDELRRGQPTCHIAYDEATAILAGDGLQALAFELVCQAHSLSAEQRLSVVQLLAQASGSRGMVGGQVIDLASEGMQPNLQQLESMHSLKTGALIRAAVAMGAIAAGASPQQRVALDHYARCIGLAFQVQDDILDIESDTETLGKAQGADEKHNKATYPSLLGLSAAKQKAQTLVADAKASLEPINGNVRNLEALADFIIQRRF